MPAIRNHGHDDFADYPDKYKPKRDVRSRKWLVTFNNWTEEGRLQLEQLQVIWGIYAEETAPDTGTPHLQGYLLFKEKQRWTELCRKVSHMHMARGNGLSHTITIGAQMLVPTSKRK